MHIFDTLVHGKYEKDNRTSLNINKHILHVDQDLDTYVYLRACSRLFQIPVFVLETYIRYRE